MSDILSENDLQHESESTKESVSRISKQKQPETVDSCFCGNKLTAHRIVTVIICCKYNLRN